METQVELLTPRPAQGRGSASENSEVSPVGLVAVAETHWPAVVATFRVAVNVALPEESVATVIEPR